MRAIICKHITKLFPYGARVVAVNIMAADILDPNVIRLLTAMILVMWNGVLVYFLRTNLNNKLLVNVEV